MSDPMAETNDVDVELQLEDIEVSEEEVSALFMRERQDVTH